jgi:predicted  nucleic acid-binding Zn-ribbon protein
MFNNLDSMDWASGSVGVAGLLLSSFVYLRSQRLKTSVEHEAVHTEQMQTIFDGYGGVVSTLQEELERLKLIIEDMRIEQEACERRNSVLSIEILELHQRIASLEKKSG